jgi:hypothetical protein
MAHAAHEAECRAAEAEEAAQRAHMEAACLKRGLELAAEQLTRSTGAEVPGTLLEAVARVRPCLVASCFVLPSIHCVGRPIKCRQMTGGKPQSIMKLK